MDTHLHSVNVRVERKRFAFDVKENPQGTFLRITEEGGAHRNSIVIPATGLEMFRGALNEVIESIKVPVESRATPRSGRLNPGVSVPDKIWGT